jgi:hypothetical protein
MSDFNENVTISVMRDLAMQVAGFWMRHIRPTPFDAVFHQNGIRVRIQIDEYKSAEDTQPIKRVE